MRGSISLTTDLRHVQHRRDALLKHIIEAGRQHDATLQPWANITHLLDLLRSDASDNIAGSNAAIAVVAYRMVTGWSGPSAATREWLVTGSQNRRTSSALHVRLNLRLL